MVSHAQRNPKRRFEAIQNAVRTAITDEVAVARGLMERVANALAAVALRRPKKRNTIVPDRTPKLFAGAPRRARKRPARHGRRRAAR